MQRKQFYFIFILLWSFNVDGKTSNILKLSCEYNPELIKKESNVPSTKDNQKINIDENATLREEKVADSEEHVVIGRTRPHIYQHQRSREDLRRFPGRGYKLGSS